MNTKTIYTSLFFLLIFISGFWMSSLGKPYNTLLFTIHKLVGVGLGFFLIINVRGIGKAMPLTPLETSVLVIAILIFVVLVVAGGLLSIHAAGGLSNVGPAVWNAITVVHKVFPYLAVLSTAAILYFLLYRRA